jgi:hypothetical protein
MNLWYLRKSVPPTIFFIGLFPIGEVPSSSKHAGLEHTSAQASGIDGRRDIFWKAATSPPEKSVT